MESIKEFELSYGENEESESELEESQTFQNQHYQGRSRKDYPNIANNKLMFEADTKPKYQKNTQNRSHDSHFIGSSFGRNSIPVLNEIINESKLKQTQI